MSLNPWDVPTPQVKALLFLRLIEVIDGVRVPISEWVKVNTVDMNSVVQSIILCTAMPPDYDPHIVNHSGLVAEVSPLFHKLTGPVIVDGFGTEVFSHPAVVSNGRLAVVTSITYHQAEELFGHD